MKRTLITLTLVTGLIYSSEAQVSFAPEAGINLSKLDYSPSAGESSMKIGAKVGVVADIGISEHFSVQPGIFYSMKGGSIKATLLGISSEQKLSLNYVDIPVMAIYKFDVGAGQLFVGVGPNVGIAISGKNKGTITGGGPGIDTTEDSDIKFGSETSQLKRIDFGGNVNVGYELPMGLYLRLGYNMGFVNLSNTPGGSIKNTGFNVSIGYMFGRKKDY